MVPIYKDPAPHKVIQKCVQWGGTEYAICWAFARAHRGLSGVYVLPTKVVRDQFVANRINGLLDRAPWYKAQVGRTDATILKQFGAGVLKFLGSNVATDFTEFPAQFYIVDELDRCDLGDMNRSHYGLKMLEDRTSSTHLLTGKVAEWIKLSNPTIAGYGISLEYQKSSRAQWFVPCPHCGEKQPLDWFGGVVEQTDDNGYELKSHTHSPSIGGGVDILCRHCNKALDRLADGEWVHEFPNRDVSGYHISKMFTAQTTLDAMWASFQNCLSNPTEKQWFYNSELGIPYSGDGDKLTFGDFDKCISDYALPKRATGAVAGVDVGGVLHVRIDMLRGGKRRLVHAGIVPTWNELERLFKLYGVTTFVVDAMPEMHLARKFVHDHPGGFVCDFSQPTSVVETKIDRRDRKIKGNRTAMCDQMVAAYLDQLIELPSDYRGLDRGDWTKQMMAPTRILDASRKPPCFIWDEGALPDHHFFADVYSHQAALIRGFAQKAYGGEWA